MRNRTRHHASLRGCGPDRLQRRKTMRHGEDLPLYLGLSMGDTHLRGGQTS
jgi:hypothetical protein